jgi:predicted MPP superfamily phosphohydrolase
MIVRTLILLAVLFIIDFYVFQGVKLLTRNAAPHTSRIIAIAFWSVSVFCFSVIITGLFIDWHTWPKAIRTYSFAFIFVTYFSKLFFVLFLLIDDIFRLFRLVTGWITSKPAVAATEGAIEATTGISRSSFLIKMGAVIAALPFTALLFGMIKGKYDYQVKNIKLAFNKLPAAFNGFKIVQISDIHTGSFMDKAPLEKAVKLINDLKPDVIFFTGDLVNDMSTELLPYKDILAGFKAPHGVFSILGNHDYGDYYQWPSKEDKVANLDKLIASHKEMGWDILLDEHRKITKDGESISVIGVQNWSARMNFRRYGDLNKALENIAYSPVNILLSHDPSHWKAEVAGKVPEIDLTLAGHTHGFQFGVEIPGFRWSPVQYVYHEWAGLYSENQQHLYVNRGLGFLGYPGRVGILPEITLFEFNRS